ncbi:acyl carrier protein 2 mitochondrial-like [Tripterygium wilfordii]|uniref:Acyl carrier protein 2 mitochondrial-like n=1 Tax=Tripterygium wilfordii TaxID=458696 RepID=A0A7J7CTR4_TRIWF|nr:uncharacterized protein LOC120012270 isoform X2 [Tripterygium wilfordii]KAF5737461.1 acyl carrier protein 2 mitochondrial-like [Tripterygium wilfordii]
MQAARAGIRALKLQPSSQSYPYRRFDNAVSPSLSASKGGVVLVLIGARVYSQTAPCFPYLEKKEVTSRVLDLLKSVAFTHPSKSAEGISTTADLICHIDSDP